MRVDAEAPFAATDQKDGLEDLFRAVQAPLPSNSWDQGCFAFLGLREKIMEVAHSVIRRSLQPTNNMATWP